MNTTKENFTATLADYRSSSKMLYTKDFPMTEVEVLELIIEDEKAILSQFGLPNLRCYTKLLRKFGCTENEDFHSSIRLIKQLEMAAKKFLLKPVLPIAQRLDLAKRNNEHPFDILPEIGFSTHHFNVFLYSNLFMNNHATADDILNDLCLARNHEELPYIFNLALIADYKAEPEYVFFQQSGFKFIDAYCCQKFYLPESLPTKYKKAKDHHFRLFNISGLVLTDITFDAVSDPNLFCTWDCFGKRKEIQIGLTYEQLYSLLKSCGSIGETITDIIIAKRNTLSDELFEVLDLDNYTGPLILEHSNFKIYKPLIETDNKKLIEYDSNFFMLEEMAIAELQQ